MIYIILSNISATHLQTILSENVRVESFKLKIISNVWILDIIIYSNQQLKTK